MRVKPGGEARRLAQLWRWTASGWRREILAPCRDRRGLFAAHERLHSRHRLRRLNEELVDDVHEGVAHEEALKHAERSFLNAQNCRAQPRANINIESRGTVSAPQVTRGKEGRTHRSSQALNF
eukprot:scaffold5939_cov165-Ochromonas_danica.AAC.15